MASMHRKSGKGKKTKRIGQAEVLTREQYESLELDTRIALIQQLIPIGLMAVAEELDREVVELAGGRYERRGGDGENDAYRHGSNPGSIKLMGQRVGILVPRVRSQTGEIPLQSYQLLHQGKELDEELFRRVLYGISCRNYEAASMAIPEAIGVSKSTGYPGSSSRRAARSSRPFRSGTSAGWTSWRCSWTARASPRTRW